MILNFFFDDSGGRSERTDFVAERFQRRRYRLALRRRIFRELSDFVGDDGKAFSRFSRMSSFDRGVHRKEVRLPCDILNNVRRFHEAARFFRDLLRDARLN